MLPEYSDQIPVLSASNVAGSPGHLSDVTNPGLNRQGALKSSAILEALKMVRASYLPGIEIVLFYSAI